MARMTTSGRGRPRTPRWSAEVTKHSNALTLTPGLFTFRDPLATSLKQSAERSRRRKGSPLQSAMSMLNFYLNRAGPKLSAERKRVLDLAKLELRKLFER
jgi:hypothetical protein